MSRLSPVRDLLSSPLAASLYAPSLIYAFAYCMLIPILPLYASSFEVSYGLVGLVVAGEAIGLLAGDVPAGMLLRRFGQKRVMLFGLGCTALATMALFRAASIPEALVYRLLAGSGAALYNVSRHDYIASTVRVGSRGKAIALYGGIYRMGRFVGPALGAAVADLAGLRAPFLVFGAACGLAFFMVWYYLPAAGDRLPAPAAHASSLFDVLKSYSGLYAAAGLGQIFAQMIRSGTQLIIPLYAADVLDLGVTEVGLIVSIAGAMDVLLFVPAGLVMDRFGRKYAIVPSFVVQALGMALVPLTANFAGLLCAASLIGFANGLSSGTMMTIGSDLAPSEARGEFLGMWRLIGDIGATGGPLAVGGVAGLLALQTSALVISGTGALAASIFAFLVPETLKSRSGAA